jgi:hypothetical protein
MELSKAQPEVEIPAALVEAIRSFPPRREVTHCGETFTISPFDIYAECRRCGTRIKVRSFSGMAEIEDIFDAVFEWIDRAKADDLVRNRQAALREDRED